MVFQKQQHDFYSFYDTHWLNVENSFQHTLKTRRYMLTKSKRIPSNTIPILGFEIIKHSGDFNFSIAYSRPTSICWEVESVNDH